MGESVTLLLGLVNSNFGSNSELAIFLVVVAGAALFFTYLIADGVYHRRKWRRIQRKFKESK
jgi:hypothetical protein